MNANVKRPVILFKNGVVKLKLRRKCRGCPIIITINCWEAGKRPMWCEGCKEYAGQIPEEVIERHEVKNVSNY